MVRDFTLSICQAKVVVVYAPQKVCKESRDTAKLLASSLNAATFYALQRNPPRFLS